ncbi:MAG: methyltransferase domain-containing protein [Proteobacteria bacterium]|nr:methyltransferase domain-containing protein [Pseudomonadota bacterium]
MLDIGCGPGYLAASMGAAVGSGGRVDGVDGSESMLALARSRCADQAWVTFHPGDATDLPFDDGAFDVAVSTQVLEYVADIDTALAEIHRVLRPGGRAVIVDTDWDNLVWHSGDAARMRRVLAAWDEHLVDPHLPRTLARRLKDQGFRVRAEVIPIINIVLEPNTYSYGILGEIQDFVAGRQGVSAEEADAWAEDLHDLGRAGKYFFSLNRYLFAAEKG